MLLCGKPHPHRSKMQPMPKSLVLQGFFGFLSKEEAIIEMVDSNLQRERILPSEKAKAYKMKWML